MRLFAELGGLVESRWRDKNYEENLFPEIAAHALSELKLSERVDPWEIIRWVHTTPSLPEQMDLDALFGDPPLTLYAGSRFYIDVYFWLDGTTSIHQHKFSGAFQVLLGSSVHAEYRFEKEKEINPHFLIGKVLLGDVSLLRKGDIKTIIQGPQYIHSLFHLERPSATITVRSYGAPAFPVQYSYRKPYIAHNPFFKDALLIKKVQTVSLLISMKHPEADKFIGDLVESSDFQTSYSVLEKAFEVLCHRELEEIVGVSRSFDRFQALLKRARLKHGEFADLLLPVFEEEWRQNEIARRRSQIKGEDHRFFLALLLNVPGKTNVLRLVNERFPDKDPVDLVVGWVRELAAMKIFGSHEPNVLGLENFDEGHVFVFRGLLQDLTLEEIQTRATAEPGPASKRKLSIVDVANQITSLSLFKSIFANGSV